MTSVTIRIVSGVALMIKPNTVGQVVSLSYSQCKISASSKFHSTNGDFGYSFCLGAAINSSAGPTPHPHFTMPLNPVSPNNLLRFIHAKFCRISLSAWLILAPHSSL
jgi:hypothetical protein